jgi:hypothetical protein
MAEVTSTDDEPQLTTAIIVLGEAMFFKPQAHVISITLLQREQFADALDQMAGPDSLDTIHVAVKTSDISELYDGEALHNFMPCLRAGAVFTVHVIAGENQVSGDDDSATIRLSLVMAGLRFKSDCLQGDGSRTITAVKPGGDESDEEDSSDDES